MNKIGDKVKARYTDAVGSKIVWDGRIIALVEGDFLVDVGGVAIRFKQEELSDGEAGTEVNQSGA